MALSTRQRWMLYGVAALLTGAAMLAVQPQQEAGEAAATLPAARPARALPAGAASPAPAVPAGPLALPQRPYGGAGRSPFGDPALAAAAAAAQAAAAAPPPPLDSTAAAPATTAAALPFRFLGRWTEDGTSTVFLAQGQRQFTAVAGRHLTPDYLVEHIGARELRLLHVPTGTRQTLALAAGQTASAPAAGPAPAAADTEEQN
ncbi:MAG: hypothetical protein DI587_02035 [Variovorax paradoxus]|nr:MAG: hypothetical protein DI583_02035 [Variovorax paradoxus]PZQ16799.1 MAG: hypothetical protein DI587_02035 [Variovorax paradoxus]